MKWAGNSASTEEVRSGAVAGAVLIGLGAVAGVAKRLLDKAGGGGGCGPATVAGVRSPESL